MRDKVRRLILRLAWIGFLFVVLGPLAWLYESNLVYADSGSNGNGIAASPSAEPSAPLVAVPIDGLWQEFGFGAAGTFATACTSCAPSSGGNSQFAGVPPWTFTAGSNGANLTVVDAFNLGDQFEVFDNNVPLGLTSIPGTGNCGDDPIPCLNNPDASRRVFTLGPGAHSITIKLALSPFGAGAAYFRVSSTPQGIERLTLSPASGIYVLTESFDVTLIVELLSGVTVTGGSATLDGSDVTAALVACIHGGTLTGTRGGVTYRCPGVTGGVIGGVGMHAFKVNLTLSNTHLLTQTVNWEVWGNHEP